MPRSRHTASHIDTLEPRRLLAASIGLTPSGGLVIQGTEKSDAIRLSLVKGQPDTLEVKVNRLRQTFKLADITQGITIRSLGGNDNISVSEKNGAISVPFTVYAGAGNDKVSTGSGDDIVDGGEGNDNLQGGAGDDLLTGGNGNDNCSGGAGDDEIHGGAGNDNIRGDAGDDDLEGDAGNDNLQGNDGNDDLLGDEGNDRLQGQNGDDDLSGGDGNDNLDGGAGDDYCDGDAGKDNVRGRKGNNTFAPDDSESERKDFAEDEDEIAPTFDSLPDAVKNRFAALFAGKGTPIKVATEDSKGDGVTDEYIFLASVNGQLHQLKVAPDGTILSHEADDDTAPLTLADLPASAQSDLQANFPNATILKLEAEDEAGDVVITVYQVKLLFQGQLFELNYTADGTRSSTESQDDGELPPSVDQLPATASAYLTTNFPGYSLKELEAEDGKFKVKFLFQGSETELRFNADGTLAGSNSGSGSDD